MAALGDNPFAVLTVVVAPAILTNASTVLCLGTSNRIARVVDRTRVVAAEIASLHSGSPDYQVLVAQLERLRVRAQLLFQALRLLYGSLGAFAASALTAVIGSASSYYGEDFIFRVFAVLGLGIGIVAVTGLVAGSILLVRETQLALKNLAEEAEMARARFSTNAE